jgi:iron complex outermembrane recepter protein
MMKNDFKTSVSLGLLMALGLGLGSATAATVEAEVSDATNSDDVTEIVVYGRGQSKQLQTLKSTELSLQTPGTSPLKAIDKLPGVSFQSADPFGTYEWSTRINIRGFNQNQLGFTLDGVPLGDMSYGNHNGLHISRAIINEDIGRVDINQGAGALSTASTSNLGGTLQFSSRAVSDTLGGELNGSLGSDSFYRVYGRFDTGAIEALNGLRAYVSVADQKTDKWKGGGEQTLRQYNAKAVLPIGEGELTGFYNYSERREQDYQDLSFDMINRLGRNWDNFQPNWARANQAGTILNTPANYLSGALNPASGYYTGVGINPYLAAGVSTPDDAYYAGAGVRDDNLYSLSYEGPLGDIIRISATAYKHTNEGQGLWYTPYRVSPNFGVVGATSDNAALSVRTTEYDVDRGGVFGALNVDLGSHQVTAGLWFETNNFNQARRFYAEDLAAPKRDPLGFQSNPFFTQWQYSFRTQTTTAFIQDIWSLTPKLKVNYGFKLMNVTNTVSTLAGNPLSSSLSSKDDFLPQVGFVYEWSPKVELFGSYSENMAAYVSAATAGPFSSQNQANVDFVAQNLKPETSKTLEGGMRLNWGNLKGVAALYHVEFDNRLLAIQQGAAIVGNASVLSNVGSVETNGLELAGTWKLSKDISIFSSYSYNRSEYADNYTSNGVTFDTSGKTVVNTPETLFNLEGAYDNGSLFGSLGVKYTGARFYTYENIGGKVDGFAIADLSLGYRFGKAWDVQLNLTNLTDEDYISTIGSAGFANKDVSGTNQTILSGAPRQASVTLRKRF